MTLAEEDFLVLKREFGFGSGAEHTLGFFQISGFT